METLPDPIEIAPLEGPLDCVVEVPGSKSITNRVLILSALASGRSLLKGALFSDDSRHLAACLKALGAGVEADESRREIRVEGLAGKVPEGHATEFFVGNAGTAARFLPPLAALGSGSYIFKGDERMSARPMQALVDVLVKQGAGFKPLAGNPRGYPFELRAHGLAGGAVEIDISESSQFASGLLMAGPLMKQPLILALKGSRGEIPYVDMTAALMGVFGGQATRREDAFEVPRGGYTGLEYDIEPDVSGACYFYAAAALLGGRVTVKGLSRQSLQGDIRFLGLLKHMGCQFFEDEDLGGLTLEKDPRLPLKGVDVDMNAFSDQALTLAALAPFCSGPVIIRHVAHIREQESDRLEAILVNLRALGARAEALPGGDGVAIQPARPGELHGAVLDTFKDHRVAMAFSLAGLKVPGIFVKDPACVKKTFESYWGVFASLRQGHA